MKKQSEKKQNSLKLIVLFIIVCNSCCALCQNSSDTKTYYISGPNEPIEDLREKVLLNGDRKSVV